MLSFSALLIHTCSIQAKTLSTSGYEKTTAWTDASTLVPCRHDYDGGISISNGEVRKNTDDDIFFFNPDASIVEGNRIVHDGKTYDVIKVQKFYDCAALHHLEVAGRFVSTD